MYFLPKKRHENIQTYPDIYIFIMIMICYIYPLLLSFRFVTVIPFSSFLLDSSVDAVRRVANHRLASSIAEVRVAKEEHDFTSPLASVSQGVDLPSG